MLGKHAEMADHLNTGIHKVFDDPGEGTLQLDGISAGFHKFPCTRKGLFRSVIGVGRQINRHGSMGNAPTDGFQVMDHLIQRDIHCVLLTQNNHSQRVADQNQIDAGFIQEPCRRVVVSREPGLVVALGFG